MAFVYEPPGSTASARQAGPPGLGQRGPSLGPGWYQSLGYNYGPDGRPTGALQPMGWHAPISEDVVMASQGAGGRGGTSFLEGLTARAGQQQRLDLQQAQRQADLAGAAAARQTRGLTWQGQASGADPASQWQRMMQGLQGMYFRPGSGGAGQSWDQARAAVGPTTGQGNAWWTSRGPGGYAPDTAGSLSGFLQQANPYYQQYRGR